MVIVSPLNGVNFPFQIAFWWLINRGDPNHSKKSWDDPPTTLYLLFPHRPGNTLALLMSRWTTTGLRVCKYTKPGRRKATAATAPGPQGGQKMTSYTAMQGWYNSACFKDLNQRVRIRAIQWFIYNFHFLVQKSVPEHSQIWRNTVIEYRQDFE